MGRWILCDDDDASPSLLVAVDYINYMFNAASAAASEI